MSRRKKSEVVQSVDHAQLPREERQLVEVVRPRDEPAEEAGEAEAEHVGDALVAAERGHLAEHAVAVRLRLAGEVLGEAAGLAERVLRGRRVDLAGRGEVRDGGAVAERPDVLVALDAQRARPPSPGRARPAAARSCASIGFALTPAVQTSVCVRKRSPFESCAACGVDRLERRVDADLDPALGQLLGRVLAEPRRDLGQDLRRRVDEHPALRRVPEARVVAQRVADEVGELGERLDARVAGADEDEGQLALRGASRSAAASAASSRCRTWLRR